jgi:hypothetical protein
MPTSVYATSWRKVIGSFRSSQGHLIPPHIREQLFKYIVEGEIPPNPLRALLANDLPTALSSACNVTESTRIPAIWEFITTRMPTGMWRSYEKLEIFSKAANMQWSLQTKYEAGLRKALKKLSEEPILLD